MKIDHEEWVRESLGLDREQLRVDLRWAAIVDQFDTRVGLERWDRSIGSLVYAVEPTLSKSHINALRDLCHWIQVRPWPTGYEAMRDSLVGFARVVGELLDRFTAEAESLVDDKSEDRLKYPRWYRIIEWNPELYHQLLHEYNDARRLIDDLVYEATRHLNWFMDSVRATVDPEYREEDGYVFLLPNGAADGERTLVPRFSDDDVADGRPYKGLQDFLKIRDTRESSTYPDED